MGNCAAKCQTIEANVRRLDLSSQKVSYASWVQLGDHGWDRRKDESEFKCTQLHRVVALLDVQWTRVISRVPPGLFSSV